MLCKPDSFYHWLWILQKAPVASVSRKKTNSRFTFNWKNINILKSTLSINLETNYLVRNAVLIRVQHSSNCFSDSLLKYRVSSVRLLKSKSEVTNWDSSLKKGSKIKVTPLHNQPNTQAKSSNFLLFNKKERHFTLLYIRYLTGCTKHLHHKRKFHGYVLLCLSPDSYWFPLLIPHF